MNYSGSSVAYRVWRQKAIEGGGELFNRRGRADPMTGELEDLVIDSDWKNKYNITGPVGLGVTDPASLT